MKRLLLFTVSISLVFFFLIAAYDPYMRLEGAEESEEGERGIAGALDWWNTVRSNEQTGEMDFAAMYAAQQQADAMGATRSLGIQWEEMGPDNVGGRTRAILFDKDHQGVVFAGGVSGGIWKSINGGQSWAKVNDLLESLVVTTIVQATNGDIYFGTGEAFYSFGLNNPTGFSAFGFPGKGIWKSTDGGNTFTHLDSTTPATGNSTTEDWAYVSRLATSNTDANRIYASTNKGLRISTDGGNTWTNAVGPIISYSWDVKVGSDGYVHAVVGNKYYRSTTPNGDSFELRSGQGGFPNSGLGRIELCVASSNASYVYAVCINSGAEDLQGVYKSTDGGLNWTQIGPGGSVNFNPPGQQGTYDICINALPSDPEVIYVGGQLSMWKYSPSLGWFTVSNWLGEFFDPDIYIHADMHGIVFNPFNTAEMFIACDGGLFRSGNANNVYPIFSDLNRNFNVTQAYSVAAAPTGEVIFGTQDNGTNYIDFLGNTTMSSKEIQGGDGGNTEIGRINPNAFFAEFPAGTVTRSSSPGGGFNLFYDDRIDATGDGSVDEGADWLTPFALWEQPDTARAYYVLGAGGVGGSSGHVWFTKGAMDFGVSPDWFRFPLTSGWVTCVAFSSDGNTVFAGTSNGMVYRYSNLLAVDDAGSFKYASISSTAASWNAVDSGITVSSVQLASGRYLRWIAVDPTDANNVVVTAARYGNDENIWRSTNALGATITFSDITDNLPKMPVWSAVVDVENPNRIIIGTDLGVYARDLSNSDGWSEENGGMARVPVMVVKQVPYYGKPYLYIGTYGRGVFRSGSLVGIHSVASNISNMMLFPNPVQDKATIRISLVKSGSVEIKIYNLGGEVVQQHFQKNVGAGESTIEINTSKLHTGTYLVSATTGASSFNQKMTVIR